MQAHAHYLRLRLDQTEGRPGLHAHQRKALGELLALATSGIAPLDYVRRTRGLFALTRAEWLDRHDNQAALFDRLGEDQRAWVARELSAAAAPTEDLGPFLQATWQARSRVAPAEHAARTAQGLVPQLVLALAAWHAAQSPSERAAATQQVRLTWAALQANDPGIGWARLCEHPPYRHTLPVAPARLAPFEDGLREAVGPALHEVGALPDLPPPPAWTPPVWAEEPSIPSVAEAASGFRLAFEGLGPEPDLAPVRAIHERIFALEQGATDSTAFLRDVEAEDLVVELARAHQRVDLARTLDRAGGSHQPQLEAHVALLGEAVDRACSRTELELEVLRHSDCQRVETAWHRVLLHLAFTPWVHALASEHDRRPARIAALRRSQAQATAVLGTTWADLYAVVRLSGFFAGFLVPRAQRLITWDRSDPTTGLGELGEGLLSGLGNKLVRSVHEAVAAEGDGPWEDHRAEAIRRLDTPRFETAEALARHVDGLAARAGVDVTTPAASPRPALLLWDREVALEDLHEALQEPGRPGL